MQNSFFTTALQVIADWVMRLSIANMLWVGMNVPILFLLFLMYLSPSTEAVLLLAVPLVILLPVLFFPATTAVFAMARDWIVKKEETNLLKGFWVNLRKNYKASLLSGMILTLIWVVWILDYFFVRELHDILAVVMIGLGVLLFIYTVHFFSMAVHYHMTKRQLFKNTFFVTVGSPLLAVVILFICLSVFFINMRFMVLIPFFSLSVVAFLSFFAFYRFTLKVGEKAGEKAEQ
ncbi:MAG: DUF624 domain-containing protein [Bacillus sp. (in: Bacteria)]|nr:DUF624 domain-containing protein [Bacillus sp. (in: firmicutes)]